MSESRGERIRTDEQFPTHQQIERLAYDIYLEHGCEQDHALDHWLAAEEQLLLFAHPKATTITVGPDGTAELAPEREAVIADEELAQVRASERIKEERAVPPNRAASVRQVRTR